MRTSAFMELLHLCKVRFPMQMIIYAGLYLACFWHDFLVMYFHADNTVMIRRGRIFPALYDQ